MAREDSPPPSDRLDESVRRHRERRERAQRERRSIGQDLASVGVIGWMIVVPALLGVFAGRWLDRRFATGIFWTLGLLVAGITLGCILGWQRLTRS